KTPCAEKADKCYNCKSPDRICNALVVHYKCMKGMEMEVVLVNEDLGY
ncbi:MAG TPA: lactate utilization protein, partial [Candidatus Avoscillospira stercoripullorum]|nr:lactate utilization protein [Candidatus Avoscillospira stercoripullorum]